jgi:membrane protease YdiL (CAAX protease family)
VNELQQPQAGGAREGARVPANPPWGLIEAAMIFVVWLVLQLLLGQVVVGPPLVRQMGSVVAGSVLALALVAAFLRVRSRGRVPARRLVGLVAPGPGALRRAVWPLLYGAVAYTGVAFGWGAVLQLSGLQEAQLPPQPIVALIEGTTSTWALVLSFVAAAVFAPLVEEVLFRAVLYLPLRRALGATWAAVAVSAVFALAHNYGWGAPQLFVLSLVFVTLFERTGTLLAPIAAHGAYNAVQLIVLLSAMAGAPSAGP